MRTYDLKHLGDQALLRGLTKLVEQDRATTAAVLARISEVDTRRLYAPAGYASMYAYCFGELGLSEDAAYKRIRAARTARRFPAVFTAIADGGLHPGSRRPAGAPPDITVRDGVAHERSRQDQGRDREAARAAIPAAGRPGSAETASSLDAPASVPTGPGASCRKCNVHCSAGFRTRCLAHIAAARQTSGARAFRHASDDREKHA